MDEDAKKIILARRARFVAAALASLGVASHACGGRSEHDNTGAASGAASGVAGEAGEAAAGDAGAGSDGAGGSTAIDSPGAAGEPTVCLSVPR